MHKVVVSRAQALVSITASGFVDVAGLEAAATDLHAAIRSLEEQAGTHVTLYDLTEVKVFSPVVLELFAAYWNNPAVPFGRRIAVVSISPLVSQQMARVQAGRDTIRVFADRREALGWLLAADTERPS
ncbi:hypothetical protein [Sphingomonas bacterium]|uniref:hypothetical protein n=1 Tax=Sphingomonas bacterium TaxID=1895847 RepID=UPI00157738A0|nr:hypothetical protein [Sphingomonas bacterium]